MKNIPLDFFFNQVNIILNNKMESPDPEPPSKNLLNSHRQIISKKQIEMSLLQHIPQTVENRRLYKNGFSKIIHRLNVRVTSDIEECYFLWDEFSPKKSLFDLWDFRYAWYKGYNFQPYFYIIYERKKNLAVLPLWLNKIHNRFEWFGSDWMEDNTFFVFDEEFIDYLLAIAPTPIFLNALKISNYLEKKISLNAFEKDDPKNIKNINSFKSINELLATFSKKNRHHLKYDFNRIRSFNPKILTSYSDDNILFNKFVMMNTQRFNGKNSERSDLFDSKRKNTFKYFIKNSGLYKTKFIEVYIQNYLAAIDIIIEYKGIYYSPRGGNDINRFKGIGNFMTYIEYEEAIKKGFGSVDCLQIDYGWKHRYFDQQDLFKWEKK